MSSSLENSQGEPDVFETDDPPPPKSDFGDDTSSASVEKLPAGYTTAYGCFAGKSVTPRFVDFSDPGSHGLRAELSDYEKLLLAREDESMSDRVERLKLEVAELQQEVATLKTTAATSSSSDPGQPKLDPVQLQAEVAALQKQLSTVSLDVSAQGSLDRSKTARYLLEQADRLKKVDGGEKRSEGQSQGITYELYCRDSGSQTSASGELADVAKRLSVLEEAVGADELKTGNVIPKGLLAYTPTNDLMSAVMGLHARVALLDQGQIIDADTKLKLLLNTLHKVKEHKAQPDDERSKKIDELYSLVKKWDSIRDLLPNLIDRLVTLKDLHERGATLVNSMSDLEVSQKSIKAELAGLNEAMKLAQSSFAENLTTIQANFAALEKK
uniref:Dynactin 2 n=1 Tax=Halisarca dujardinii TaxID=2583056 RepID=A0A9F1U3Y3_HALDU|nr:dynactin 2 [Halisarca dujardinii]